MSVSSERSVTLSAPATARWNRQNYSQHTTKFNMANHRRLRNMVSTHQAQKFLSSTYTQAEETAKVSKVEELKEISSQLGILRKRHDVSHSSNANKEKKLKDLNKQMERVKKMEARTGTKLENMRERAKQLEESMEKMKRDQEDALLAGKVYEHMLERMKVSMIELERKSHELSKQVKDKNQTLKEELEKKRRKREAKIQTKEALNVLKSHVKREIMERQYNLEIIEKDVVQKQETTRKRELRMKRQIEIAEQAANEDRNQRAMVMRESMMLHRLWYVFLQEKLTSEMDQFASIEEAFKRVRMVSGLTEPQEMVEKFMVREQVYKDLVETLNQIKERVNSYNASNQDYQKKISALEIAKMSGTNPVAKLSEEVSNKIKEIATDKEKLRKLNISYENINSWAKKNLSKLQAIMDLPQTNTSETPFLEVFERMEELVNLGLKDYRENVSYK